MAEPSGGEGAYSNYLSRVLAGVGWTDSGNSTKMRNIEEENDPGEENLPLPRYVSRIHVNPAYEASESEGETEEDENENVTPRNHIDGIVENGGLFNIPPRRQAVPPNSILFSSNSNSPSNIGSPVGGQPRVPRKLSVVSFGGQARRASIIPSNFNLERRASRSINQKKPAVVVVRDGKKTYGSNAAPILNGFNMTVEEGSIYALLGSSGCGKTTILSCIVGVRSLDSGVIYVFGNRPGTRGSGIPGKNVGYMPQDLSLYDDFTINETLNYYGSLYCLPGKTVSENRKWLVEFLALPDPKRRVGSLSGGQKRRVSIAVAMIHNPSLLILDEPTVGVDPLLRETIWKHLVEQATNHNTTVIITTHYIEEAKKSNTIGLMRNGKLLAEKPPAELMQEHDATLLEDVVLKLCKKDTDESKNPETMSVVRRKAFELQADYIFPISDIPEKRPIMATIENANGSFAAPAIESLWRIFALSKKNAMFFFRNYLLLFFMLCIPAVEIILLCTALGNAPTSINFGIVNPELKWNHVNTCKALLDLPKNSTCDPGGFSCQILSLLPEDTINQIFYSSVEDAFYAVQQGKIWGYLSFPPQFSVAYHSKVVKPLSLEPAAISKIIQSSSITVEMDETSQQITATVKQVLFKAFETFTKELLVNCGKSQEFGGVPLRFGEPIIGTAEETGATKFIAAGVSIAIFFFFPSVFTSIQYIFEKKLGAMERIFVAGVQTWEMMAGFLITISFVLMAQVLLTLVIISTVFDITVSFLLCAILGILVGFAGILMGFLIGSVCKEEIEASMVGISLFFPLAFLSGLFWPKEGMPIGFFYLSYFIPGQLPGEAMRSLMTRGWGFEHSHVWPGFLASVGFCIVFWLVTIFLHKKKLTR